MNFDNNWTANTNTNMAFTMGGGSISQGNVGNGASSQSNHGGATGGSTAQKATANISVPPPSLQLMMLQQQPQLTNLETMQRLICPNLDFSAVTHAVQTGPTSWISPSHGVTTHVLDLVKPAGQPCNVRPKL